LCHPLERETDARETDARETDARETNARETDARALSDTGTCTRCSGCFILQTWAPLDLYPYDVYPFCEDSETN
jgi:hypothetical protein